jgi:two-component system response regulator AtoC
VRHAGDLVTGAVMTAARLRRLFIVIDDDPQVGDALVTMIGELGHDVEYCQDAAKGLQRVQEQQPAVVMLDVCLQGEDGLAVLDRIREVSPATSVIMISAFGEAGLIVKAMKQGASDFLSKPLERDDVRGAIDNVLEKATLQWEVEHLREQVLRGQLERRRSEYDGVFENSPRMKQIKEMIDQVADTDATVLVWGESGVGKELVARAIHDCSPRRERTFVKVNCAALPLELLESELFGYERGAFTGAHKRKPGKFELADGGTIFLDEIGEMPLPLQAKLLHVLQDREFARLGSGRDVKVDVRVVASTNKDLEKAVAQGLFREDLYYRLNVVNIHVPPLRERPEEIPILAEHFWQKYSRQYNRQRVQLSRELLARFQAHSWPGNVRELENLVKRIVVLESEEFVTQELAAREGTSGTAAGSAPAPHEAAAAVPEPRAQESPRPRTVWTPGMGLKEVSRQAAREAEHIVIKQVLEEVRWNRVEAAKRLKISYKALLYKIQMYELASARSAGKKLL